MGHFPLRSGEQNTGHGEKLAPASQEKRLHTIILLFLHGGCLSFGKVDASHVGGHFLCLHVLHHHRIRQLCISLVLASGDHLASREKYYREENPSTRSNLKSTHH
jgi:hypothetical protein